MKTINDSLSYRARQNIEETGINVVADLAALIAAQRDGSRPGVAEETLYARCVDGADRDRIQGWRDYVDALTLAALDPVGLVEVEDGSPPEPFTAALMPPDGD